MYLFEHLLVRLGKSGYAEAFVLKGGLLISSMTGVAQRITMDMDTTVIGMDMDEDTVSEAVAAICTVDVADGMEYSFERIEPIREGDEYANWRAHLRVRYGKIDAPLKITIMFRGRFAFPGTRMCLPSRGWFWHCKRELRFESDSSVWASSAVRVPTGLCSRFESDSSVWASSRMNVFRLRRALARRSPPS